MAVQLANGLQELGIRVWYDAQLRVGEPWAREIMRRLVLADAILVLATPSSVESHWVTHEWSTAMAGSHLVIPIVVGGGFEILRGPLAQLQGVRYEPGDPQSLTELARRLESLSPRTELSRGTPHEDCAIGSPKSGMTDDLARVVEMTVRQTMKALAPDLHRRTDATGDLVFLISALSADMDSVAGAVKAAASSVGLTAKRVKDVPGDYRITDQILNMIGEARLVVADLTHERPNVYFELGYARGLGKRVVTTLRDTAAAHFDVKDWTYIKYSDSRPLEVELRARFEYEIGLDSG